jgi:Flp pilus assembly pilin Flp
MRIPNTTKSRRGAGIVEYGLIVGLIAVGAVVAVQNSGDRVSELLNTVAAELGTVQNSVANTGVTGGNQSAPPALDPTTCASVGDTCNDGTIYLGTAPNSTEDLYTMPADLAKQYAWDGDANIGFNHAFNAQVTDALNKEDGRANVDNLLGGDGVDDSGDDYGPHPAAAACATIEANGHTDWYLPAALERDILVNELSSSGWSSTEHPTKKEKKARPRSFAEAFKDNKKNVRCVRRP